MKKTAFDIEFESCPLLIKSFLQYIRTIRGKEKNTIITYYYALKQFFLFILKNKNLITSDAPNYKQLELLNDEIIRSITADDILSYLYYCSSELNQAAATRSKELSAIKRYFDYLYSHKHTISINPAINIDTPKKPQKLPKYLTLEQALALLNAIDGDFKERDTCIIVLFLNCGIRISELVGINYKDIRPDNTILIHGKGNKERILTLNKACINAINAYKAERPVEKLTDKEAFFISRQYNRLSENAVRDIVEKNMKKIGLGGQGYSPHKLRHTAATLMHNEGGVDIRTLQSFLGHKNLATTQIYTHISDEQIKKAVESNPLSNFIK